MYKSDFPIFTVHPELIYLDSAASAQKPLEMLNAMNNFYTHDYSNVHRGNCTLAVTATELYEKARQTVANFIHAKDRNIVFTSGATGAINMVANGYAQTLKDDDEILVSVAEHHANFVPWQQACLRTGAKFTVVDVLPDGRIDMEDLKSKLNSKTKMVAVTHLSNVMGVVNPVHEICTLAHQYGAKVLIDGAQSVAHLPVNVTEMDCDYFVFSSHKLYGPTGMGVLYGKTDALEAVPPYQFGGDMIKDVHLDHTTFADIPARLEAGTTAFVQAVGMASAMDYVSKIGMNNIAQSEQNLTNLLLDDLKTMPDVDILGGGHFNTGLVSFNMKGIHAADLAFMLAKQNICVRVGHHCAMPIHACFNTAVSLRVSFGLYNDEEDVNQFMKALKKAASFF